MKSSRKFFSQYTLAAFSALLSVMALVALIGCAGMAGASGSSASARGNAALGADELDAAIREASDYLKGRIPPGSKVAFINFSGGYPDLADYVLSDLSKYAVNDGVFSVVDRAQLDMVREELNFNLSGEVSDQSAQEIGKMLGAQTIVSGSVRRIGSLFRLDVKAIEVQTATVQGQWNRNIPNGATIAALTETTGSSTAASGGRTATASGGGTSGGQAAAPEARVLKNGTYTLNPRPRARQAGGTWEEQYVSKVEVEDDFITFYFEDRPQGGSGYGGNVSRWRDQCYLIDLNRPTLRRKVTGNTDHNGWGLKTCIFPYINSNRFRMETSDYEEYFIAEIIIPDEPDL